MSPDSALVTGGVPEGATVRALADPGCQYALYIHGGIQIDLELDLPAGNYTYEWIDTKTGETVESGKLEHAGGRAILASPEFETDIALGVRRR